MSERYCDYCGEGVVEYIAETANEICTSCGAVATSSEDWDCDIGFDHATGKRNGTYMSDWEGEIGGIIKKSRVVRESKTVAAYISQVVDTLRIPPHLSLEIYNMIRQHAFNDITKRQKMRKTVAAVAYIACRRNNVAITLMEVADAVGMDFFALGACYKTILKDFNISLELQDPTVLIEKMMFDLADILVYDNLMSKRQLLDRTNKLVKMSCEKWLDTGRKPLCLVAAAIKIVSLINNQKLLLSVIANKLTIGLVSVQRRYREMIEMLLKISSHLPWGASITKQNLPQHLPFILDSLDSLSLLECKESQQQNKVETCPPAFTRATQERKERVQRIGCAKRRIQHQCDDDHIDAQDIKIEKAMRQGVSEKAIQDGYYHAPLVIENKDRLDDEQISELDMPSHELNAYLRSKEDVQILQQMNEYNNIQEPRRKRQKN
jgi:transcription initiation factor TFIIIB Brf1 subunit/transcription initiation factor TFIIB